MYGYMKEMEMEKGTGVNTHEGTSSGEKEPNEALAAFAMK